MTKVEKILGLLNETTNQRDDDKKMILLNTLSEDKLNPTERKRLEKDIWNKTLKDYRCVISTIPKYNGMKSVMGIDKDGKTTLFILPVASDDDIIYLAKQNKILK